MIDSDRQTWLAWAQTLQRWGIGAWVASVLEAAGPLTMIGAQLVYLGQPVLGTALPASQLDSLARLLEEPHQIQAFVRYLREAPSP